VDVTVRAQAVGLTLGRDAIS